MKGIILSGGSGTRLYPITKSISKQILPIYDKPMIYYPLSVLMLAGIRDVMIISTVRDIPDFENLLGDGSDIGMNFSYCIQDKPNGIAEAFILAEQFIGDDSVALILGDNVFYGGRFSDVLSSSVEKINQGAGAVIFGYRVHNPSEFGIVEFDHEGNAINLEEKPNNPKSDYAIPGLYFYDNTVVQVAKEIKPSARGELEITTVNEEYMKQGRLKVSVLGRGVAWLDTGTYDGLLEAANFVSIFQKRQGLYVSCIEEIAYRKKYINREQLSELAKPLMKTEYGQYLSRLLEEK